MKRLPRTKKDDTPEEQPDLKHGYPRQTKTAFEIGGFPITYAEKGGNQRRYYFGSIQIAYARIGNGFDYYSLGPDNPVKEKHFKTEGDLNEHIRFELTGFPNAVKK